MSPDSAAPFFTTDRNRFARAGVLLAIYFVLLAGCHYISYEIRFDFIVPPEYQTGRLASLALATPLGLIFLLFFGQFGSLLTYFSIPDLLRIVGAMAASMLCTFALSLVVMRGAVLPRGVLLIDFVLSVAALSTFRLVLRIYRERYAGGPMQSRRLVRRIAILGAGDAGASLAHEALSKPSLGLKPIFFLDDNPRKRGALIHGLPVLGGLEDIGALRELHRVDTCVLAMPSLPGRRVQQVYRMLAAEGLKVEIVPTLAELTTGRVQVTKIRPVQVEDLLAREAVNLQSMELENLVTERVVLVSGAGGSIGSELCRQIASLNPKRLLMVEQSEGSLFAIEQELNAAGYGTVALPLIADVLDGARMRFILGRYTPDVIFHAAAHKHVYMMERQPGEAVKNNTTGTRRFAELASELGVATFVLISTDKAINPTSVMGATKRLAEMHLQVIQNRPGNRTRFIAVRFGNVLGSSGSVIPIFKQQIAAGGPVTVTHPEVTRYFMTIPEAVGLVLQTAVLGQGGEIFVLDMGSPVKIIDLARNLIELSGLRPDEDIEIKFTGLRPGEKLFEELQHHTEQLQPTTHPRVMRFVSSPPPEEWRQMCIGEVEDPCHGLNGQGQPVELEPNQLKQLLKKLVPEYTPFLD